jgi:hypothetical protein
MPQLNGTLQRHCCSCVLSCKKKTLSLELRSNGDDKRLRTEQRDIRKNCREKTLSLKLRSSIDGP